MFLVNYIKRGRTKQKLGPEQQKWIDALKSGKYKQGAVYLKSERAYCCLGIAVELIDGFSDETTFMGIAITTDEGKTCALPTSAMKHFKFLDDFGDASHRVHAESLSYLNDCGASFKQIAEIVENDPSVYFTGEA